MKRKIIMTLVLGCSIHAACLAQEAMSLYACMAYAVENSSKKKIQDADNADALVSRRDAILKAFTPKVSAGTYAYSNFGRAVDPETNTYISSTSFNNGYSVDGSITLFDGFSALNNIKISNIAVKMGISQEQKLRDEICLSVMEAYYNVLFHTQMVEVMESQIEAARSNLTLVKKQLELGQKGRADVVQMEADLADREYQLINSRNQKDEAVLTLKALMLWPVEEVLPVDMSAVRDSFELPEICMESAALPEICMESAAEITSFAHENNPAVRIAKGKMDQARYELKTAKWQFLPSLSLNGGWSTSYYTYPGRKDYQAIPFGTQFRNNGGEYIQLSLSIPIYDRLSRHSNLSKKKNDWRRAQAEYEQTLHDVESEISRAIQDSKGALAAFFQAEKRSVVQEEAYRLGERKMLQGLISPIEFQTVSNDYLNAKAEQLNTRFQYLLKSSVVSYYKGISYLDQYK